MDCLFENDPINQKSLIGKRIKITTIDKKEHEGALHVIDPISNTVVLVNESKKSLKLLMWHAIESVEVSHEETGAESNFPGDALLFESDIEERRVRLRNWFKKHFIEVTEDGLTFRLQDVFYITPPYTIDQCVCSNKQVLERMISLIEKMP